MHILIEISIENTILKRLPLLTKLLYKFQSPSNMCLPLCIRRDRAAKPA